MRAVFIGSNQLSVMTAQLLLEENHDIVIVEKNRERIDELSEELDSGFLNGDGTRPAVLKEAEPENTDFLFCLLENDQVNLIASLVGRSQGFRRVVTRIEDPAFEHVCIELGLEDTIVPDLATARRLADMLKGENPLEITAAIKGDARVFSFVVPQGSSFTLEQMELPERTGLVCLYRDDGFLLPTEIDQLEGGDEVVVITHKNQLPKLESRWSESATPAPEPT